MAKLYRVDAEMERMILEAGYERLPDSETGARYRKGTWRIWVSGGSTHVRTEGRIRYFTGERFMRDGVALIEREAAVVVGRNGRAFRRGPNWGIPIRRLGG